ncbi:MAG: hypothetical protein AAFW98_18290, partial [Pseudomonadota bacterium]
MSDDLRPFVEARLIEAASVERRLPAHGTRPAGAQAFWPVVGFSEDDFLGWDGTARKEYLDNLARTRGAQAAEVTRYEQVVDWVIHRVSRAEYRTAVWAWARGKAKVASFRKWAALQPLSRKTYQDRAAAAIDQIVGHLGNEQVFLEPNMCAGGSPEDPENGTEIAKLDEERPTRSPPFWRAPDAVPTHDDSDEAAEKREK